MGGRPRAGGSERGRFGFRSGRSAFAAWHAPCMKIGVSP
jgi:hypothetical protein